MNTKQLITRQLQQLLQHPDLTENVFRRYPQATQFLGLAPSSYYRIAYQRENHRSLPVSPGVYPVEAGQGFTEPSGDQLTELWLDSLVRGVLKYQLPQLTNVDVKDMLDSVSTLMAETAGPDWTSRHAYFQKG